MITQASVFTGKQRAPACSILYATSFSFSRVHAANTTFALYFEKAFAHARPIPEDAPVINDYLILHRGNKLMNLHQNYTLYN
jgi:hypothetical protein